MHNAQRDRTRNRPKRILGVSLVVSLSCVNLGPMTIERTVEAAEATPPATTYLQLIFTQSAADCAQRQKIVLEGRTTKGKAARCIRNTTDAAQPPPFARKLPPYLLEISSDTVLTQPAADASSMTVTYRSLGSEQRNDKAEADRQPISNPSGTRYQMLVFTNPVNGLETTYNDWYDHQHVPDVLKIPGFLSGQRFVRTDDDGGKELQLPRYLARFTLQTESLKATNDEITARGRDGRTRNSESFDSKTGVVAFFTAD